MTEENLLINDIKEIGIVLSTSKVWEKMKLLRFSDKKIREINARRWVWELIQNAKDSSQSNISININLEIQGNDYVLTFSHTGDPFTCKGLLSLVMQSSFKELSEDSNTGKFGTGFITTHLLSEKVFIKGIVVKYNGEKKELDFLLDRSGDTRDKIEKSIIKSVDIIKKIETDEVGFNFTNDLLRNTNFIYNLDNNGKDIAEIGINDLSSSIIFTLAFVPRIISLKVNNTEEYKLISSNTYHNDIIIYQVEKEITLEKEASVEKVEFNILVLKRGNTSISILLEKKENKFYIVPFESLTPKLFCDFPLIGTEKFSFPVIVNNSDFEVLETRDGILLGQTENQEILLEALDLYKKLLQIVSNNNFEDIYLLCSTSHSESDWVEENIVQSVRDFCYITPIVNVGNQDGELEPFINKENEQNIIFPYNTDLQLQGLLWDLCNSLSFRRKIPVKSDLNKWTSILYEDKYKYTIINLAKEIAGLNLLSSLKPKSSSKYNTIEWLNKFYDLLDLNKKNWNGYTELTLIPNQNGEFKKITGLKIDDNIDNELKDILLDFNVNIRNELVDNKIALDTFQLEKLDNTNISKLIKDKIYEQLSNENNEGRFRDDKTKLIFEKILFWFNKFEKKAEILFGDLFINSYKLFLTSDVIKNMQLSKDVNKIIIKYNLDGISGIERVLAENDKSKIKYEITKESLLSLGVGNPEAFQKAIDNDEILNLFDHKSKPTKEMYDYVNGLIERSNANVISFLETMPDIYDLEGYQKSAETVLSGIKKNGKKIKIVVRPCDGDRLIIYYQSELDTLDYEDYELWVDNNRSKPQYLTLGKILKITGIKNIPLRKLFY